MKNKPAATVERITSPLVALGALIVLPALLSTIAQSPTPLAHGLLMYLASFGLYCTGVAGNLVSTLRGGEPRSLAQLLPLIASSASLAFGMLLFALGEPLLFFTLVEAWLVLAGIHAYLEARGSGRARGLLAPLPWLAPSLLLLVLLVRGASTVEALLYVAFLHVVGLASWVAVGFLGKTYGRPIMHSYVAGLLLTLIALSTGVFFVVFLVLGVGLMLFAIGFWRRPWRGLGFWWAQASASVGLVLVLAAWVFWGAPGVFVLVHGLLLAVGVTLVVGQSIYLSPLVIAVRRGRYPPGWVYLLFPVSGALRVVDPLWAGLVVVGGLVLVLVFLRPSVRWAWLILRYGTVEGYARVYRERRHFARF